MAGLHHVVDNVLIINGFFKIFIYAVEVDVEDFYDVVQLAAGIARYLCLLCGGGVHCVLHIGRSALEQSGVHCLLVLEFLNLC